MAAVQLEASGGKAVASGQLALAVPERVPVSVHGPPLRLVWNLEAEEAGPDYAALGFLLAVFAVAYTANRSTAESVAAVALVWALLACPTTRAAIDWITRSMRE